MQFSKTFQLNTFSFFFFVLLICKNLLTLILQINIILIKRTYVPVRFKIETLVTLIEIRIVFKYVY